METMMKAICLPRTGTPDVLVYSKVAVPDVPPGCVLIKVAASGLSFGDVMIRSGIYPDMPPLPFITGFEACGEIVKVGEGVDVSVLGQRVVASAMNSHAEYAVAPAIFTAHVHESITDEFAAAIPTNYMTALKILDDIAQATEGETILVHAAAGGVGTALLQLARLRGLKIIGIAGGPDKCAFVMDQGADAAIDYLSEDVVSRVQEITDGAGVDISFNSVCGTTLHDDIEVLTPLGRLVVFGMAMGPPPPDVMTKLLSRFSDSISLRMFSFKTVAVHNPAEVGNLLHRLMDLLAAGKITPAICKTFDLRDAALAHEMMESRKVLGKIIFKLSA
ncbi:Quinone oxidoreductase [hydrothermal vent metagenome]|uniref:Quinone oxidoreductase n=1 Tax=hydrothermal vent metagenome TaxID=652676 RepID=A0A3B0SWS0_9ZZZZ